MKMYRVKKEYGSLGKMDPYFFGTLLALYELETEIQEGRVSINTNIGNIWRYSMKIMNIYHYTLEKRLEALVEMGLATKTEIFRGNRPYEKIYRLTRKGKMFAEALEKIIFS